ncbi:MAG: ribosome recycling factor [Candidatus Woykebacteria bacterium RIFCSPHIGHO2_01_FULL_39_12]|uniref:Ribosome-recycling factor n=1 Tax=Candidatus Woykebacteria bacterium RIFCSPHIGHO2_01_FULL_39_12 TaxID=1802599 RepID=A0A1G1WJV6_9BACT|nr:MAG: ribosome recycling factor [Candidatus Woykebacteria bacterium RIFCSPHIGHO2_01_FULL_39_12]
MEASLSNIKERMAKALEHLKRELSAIRGGRANPSIIENIKVEAYGSQMDLRDVGSISAQDASLLVVSVWDPSNVDAVIKAIRDSNRGLNPVADGGAVRIPLPPLTEERRKELVRTVHDKAESARVAIRNVRREAIEDLERQKESKEISEDDLFRGKEDIQKITDSISSELELFVKAKEEEIIKI